MIGWWLRLVGGPWGDFDRHVPDGLHGKLGDRIQIPRRENGRVVVHIWKRDPEADRFVYAGTEDEQ